jgi:hypothetical protein
MRTVRFLALALVAFLAFVAAREGVRVLYAQPV